MKVAKKAAKSQNMVKPAAGRITLRDGGEMGAAMHLAPNGKLTSVQIAKGTARRSRSSSVELGAGGR